jgi:hypothetical protein
LSLITAFALMLAASAAAAVRAVAVWGPMVRRRLAKPNRRGALERLASCRDGLQ